jgi:hypothetical protein
MDISILVGKFRMLQAKELFRLIHQQPFQPMRIHLQDGRIFEIPHEGLVVVGSNFLDIGVLAPGDPRPGYDTIETVPLETVSRVERLTCSASTITT